MGSQEKGAGRAEIACPMCNYMITSAVDGYHHITHHGVANAAIAFDRPDLINCGTWQNAGTLRRAVRNWIGRAFARG